MKKYTLWVSNASCIAEILELGNDLLRYDNLSWDELIQLQKYSLRQGCRCIVIEAEPEA